MRSTRRLAAAAALTAAALLTTSACVGAKKSDTNTKRNAAAKKVTLTVADNSIRGGKNDAGAEWMEKYVIPRFEQAEKKKGIDATVTHQGSGAEDEAFKQKMALDLKTGGGADVITLDGVWLGEFAQAGYVKPIDTVVGKNVEDWDGWKQVPKAVQQNAVFEGKRYAVPGGTDGRVLYFNKKLFARAGLPSDWQPKSWDDILAAGRKLKKVSGVTPIQLNAGTPDGEATSMQGFLPLLAGAGSEIYDPDSKKWQGATPQVKDVLTFYQQIYGTGLGDAKLQQDQNGRDESFAEFSQGKIGILLESDYLWRSVVCPDKTICGTTSMKDRNSVVGWAKIPAMKPGSGVDGQDFVSMSGGGINVINPGSKYPQQAWDLLKFMSSAEAIKARLAGTAQITQRTDVNDEVLKSDPLLNFISQQVLPITRFRPGLAAYSQTVTEAIQQATGDVASGKSVASALSTYQKAVEKGVGGSSHVATG